MSATRPDPALIAALNEALDDEYRAFATYDQVLADFGEVRPFSNIRDSEGRHIDALHRIYRRLNLDIPPNPWPRRVPRFPSLAAACEAAAQGEIDNLEMYRRLKASTDDPEVLRVFENLETASRERHLPAFRRCAARRGR